MRFAAARREAIVEVGLENWLVAKDFRRADRDQQFLLPPDLRDWLPEGHLVWFVIDTVAQLDLEAFCKRAKLGGVGREAYDPATLLALLIYAYALGERSSRRIERLCETDVAFKVITGLDVPDHTTLARFRAAHDEAFTSVFAQVLVLCRRQGLARFGVVAIDGTKIAADAAKAANRSEESLRREAERIVAEAAQVDAAEDAELGADRGDELPEQLRDPRTRQARIGQALKEFAAEQADERAAALAEAHVEHYQERAVGADGRVEQAREAAQRSWEGRHGRTGPPAVPPDEHSQVKRARERAQRAHARVEAAQQRAARPPARRSSLVGNVTDPQSRLLKAREGFVQGYNAQLAVTDDQVIAAVQVTTDSADVGAFTAMMTAAVDAAQMLTDATGVETAVGTIVADAGYFSEANLTAAGPDRLIANSDRRRTDDTSKDLPTSGPPPPDASPLEAMRHRMRDPEQLVIYRRRAVTVEPVNGMLKQRHGMRRFSRRGRPAVLAELTLASAVHNLLKLHTAPATG